MKASLSIRDKGAFGRLERRNGSAHRDFIGKLSSAGIPGWPIRKAHPNGFFLVA